MEEMESMGEMKARSAISRNSEDPDNPENDSEDPMKLTEEMKQEILKNYLKEKQKAKKARQREDKIKRKL